MALFPWQREEKYSGQLGQGAVKRGIIEKKLMDANGEFLSTVEKAALCTFDPSESELIGRGLRDYMWTCMFVKL